MKKLYFLLSTMICATVTFAQVVPGGDMETWRTGTSNGFLTYPTRTIHAPAGWLSLDSLIIAEGELAAFAGLGGNGNDYWPQVFEENTIVHGGSHSAKLVTVKQDTLGIFPGSIQNYHTNVNTSTFATFNYGGLPVTERMHSVSAWVQYKSGKIAGVPAADTGVLNVQAIAFIGGHDSIIGTGSAMIDTTSVWQQVTANITYTDGVSIPDTMRIAFFSTNGATVDSSVLYVDDVTMMNALGVEKTILTNELINIFPNPATNTINFEIAVNSELSFKLYSVSGQLVADKKIAGNDALNTTDLQSGLYFYNILNNAGEIVQKGKISILR